MEIYNDDCFNIFPKIKQKVDLVLVDLPYNCLNLKWDTEIDLKRMWVELDTICKKDCVYLFFTNTKFGYKLIQSNEKMFKYEIVWQKSRKVGFLQAKNQPLKQTEYVYVFKKTKGCYNPQMTTGKPYKTSGNTANDDYLYENRLKEFKAVDNKGTRYPTNIVKFNNPVKSVHPTQKPVDLCEYLVKTYSKEGELVLDFTMGSGSTGVACKNTCRKFIGVEKDEKIFKTAQKRLEK
jgi:site-specific DNA-methyltransferase (adenine-specific)